MRARRARVAFVLALVTAGALALSSYAQAAVFVHSSPNGAGFRVDVSSDTGDVMTVACPGTNILVNGLDPIEGPLACDQVTQINVMGGPGIDDVTLNDLTAAKFPLLSANQNTSVFLNDGDDFLHAGSATLRVFASGGLGSDQITTGSGDDYVTDDGICTACIPATFGADQISTNAGDDFMELVGGGDVVTSGAGQDFYRVDSGSGTVSITDTGPCCSNDFAEFFGTAGPDNVTITDTQITNGTLTVTYAGIENPSASGDEGNDVISAAAATVRVQLYGGAGNDTLTGGSGADYLIAGVSGCSSGCPPLPPPATNDQLFGGGGNDVFDLGGAGTSSADGQAGNDTYSVTFTSTVTNATVNDTGAGGGCCDGLYANGEDTADTITVVGTQIHRGADTISFAGTDYVWLVGLGGNDTIDASGAASAGTGGFSLIGGLGTDQLTGSAYADTLTGDEFSCFGCGGAVPFPSPNDTLLGGGGADTLQTAGGGDTLDGQNGGDYYNVNHTVGPGAGGAAADFAGTNINDSGSDVPPCSGCFPLDQLRIDGTNGVDNAAFHAADVVWNGATLTYTGTLESVGFSGYGGDDILDAVGTSQQAFLAGQDGNDYIRGGSGNDQLSGEDYVYGCTGCLTPAPGDDTILGSGGRDLITTYGGTDSLFGGDGGDAYSVYLPAGANATVTDTGAPPADQFDYQNTDTLVGYGTTANETLTVTDSSVGSSTGGTTNVPSSIENPGADGNDGNDVVNAAAATHWESLGGGSGNDTVTGGSGSDRISDSFGSGAGSNPSGDDSLAGGPGNDSVYTATGADTLDGGAGEDYLVIQVFNPGWISTASASDSGPAPTLGQRGDTLQMAGGFGPDVINGTDTAITSGPSTGTIGAGIENVRADGNGGDDTLSAAGATRPYELYGWDGNDTLTGGAGADVLSGGGGNDTVAGGTGDDLLLIYGGSDPSIDGGEGSDTYHIEFANFTPIGTATQLDSGASGTDTMNYAPCDGVTVSVSQVVRAAETVNYAGLESTPTCDTVAPSSGIFVDAAHFLHINSDAASNVVTCVALNVKVNGNDPDTGPATCASLLGINVEAGPSANTIDLGAVAPADFTGLNPPGGGSWNSQITVFGGAGDDHLIGSAFNDALYGSSGNDQLEGRGGDDQLYGDDTECSICSPPLPPGNDNVTGGDGNDNLTSWGGTDTLDGQGDGDSYDVWRGNVNATDSAPDSTGGAYLLTDSISVHGTDAADTITLTGTGATLHAMSTGMNVTGLSTMEYLTVMGGAGDDTINASTANVPVGHSLGLWGEDGSDTLTGSAGPDFLNADDTWYTAPLVNGSDILRGGGGDDTLIASGGGTDALDGQAGNDSTEADFGSGGLIKNYDSSGANDTLEVWGSFGADTLTFTNTAATGAGGAVGSAQWGGMENVVGHGIDGNDTLTATARSLPITLFGESGDDTLNGGGGADALYGDWNGPADPAYGPPGNDTINGNAGPDVVDGGEGNDLLNGGAGADMMRGADGTDTATYAGRGAPVNASIGTGPVSGQALENDSIDATVENLIGGVAGDTLTGDANANVLDGGSGNDTLMGKDGADTLIGGVGTDTVSYADHSADVTLTLGPGADGAGGGAEGDSVGVDVENAIGGDGNDTLTGSDLANTISGGAGDDHIYGLLGNDILHGNDGNDTLDGGLGSDVLDGALGADTFIGGGNGGDQVSYADHPGGVNASIGNGANDGSPAEGDDVQADVEVVQGGAGNDTLTGDANANVLYGNAGNDTLDGMGGNDTLYGNAGLDVLSGGDGVDKLDGGTGADGLNGGNGVDTASYSARTNPVTVTIGVGVGDDGEAGEGDSVAADVENAMGGSAGDTITGSALANTLTGNGGNDTLNGGAGNDTLDGGLGADVLDGGLGGADVTTYAARVSGVTVTIGNGLADDGAPLEGDDVLPSTENVLGGSGDDDITGDASANTLVGNGGADTLRGLGAIDTLSGGIGTDHLFARGDGFADKVNCGTEFDDGEADFLDIINADCESVVRG